GVSACARGTSAAPNRRALLSHLRGASSSGEAQPMGSVPPPQPRGAANAARIAVDVPYETRVDTIGEDPRPPEPRHVHVKPRDARQPAAGYDHVRIEQVDHVRERAREPFLVTGQRRAGGRTATHGARRDLFGRCALAGHAVVIAGEPRPREPRLDAARAPAK